MTIAELQSRPDQHKEARSFRYGHVVGPGLATRDIEAWQASFPDHVLPQDLAQALTVVDGVHIWANLETRRAYFGISPLCEWQDAACVDWAAMFVEPPRGCLKPS
jgi:hypothetical protein